MAQLYGCLYEGGIPGDFKPLACVKMPDGTYVLRTEVVELSIDSITLEVNNIQVGSTDNSKDNTTYLKTKSDGTVYVEGTVTITNGVPEHWNGSVDNVAWVDVVFSGICKHIQVENMATGSPQRDLLISFDGGIKSRTIQSGYTMDVDCEVTSIKVKGSNAAATEYEMLVTV